MHQVRKEYNIRISGLGLVIASAVAAAVLSGSCFFDTKTSLCGESGLVCPSGWSCTADQSACILGSCGNGVVDEGEACDDGNIRNKDGCSADCKTDHPCGDGIVDPGEDCDAGTEDSQGCDSDCTFVECGDGHPNLAAGETCDDGKDGSPTCNSPKLCTISMCGDSYYNPMDKNEECDTGHDTQACNGSNNMNSIGNCHVPKCGDGYFNPKFTPPGIMALQEQCDTEGNSQTCNGNDNDNDTAMGLANCAIPNCGDGYVNPEFIPPRASSGEQCDTLGGSDTPTCNGNNMGSSGPGTCAIAKCGDGYKNTKSVVPDQGQGHSEECDDGGNTSTCNGNGNTTGVGNCTKPACGDNYINPAFTPTPKFSWPRTTPGEECDDGSANSDDNANACRTDCRNHFCGDGVKDSDETCDKGDPMNNKPAKGCGTLTCNSDCKGCS